MKTPLILPPGLVGDDTDFSTPGWKDANNIRFWRGLPETIGGWEKLTLETLPGVCRSVFGWKDGGSLLSFAFGLHNGLTVWQSGEVANITPTEFVAGNIDGTGGPGYGVGGYGDGGYGEPSGADWFALTWSFGTRSFGELYANPRGQGIFRWTNDTSQVAEVLPGSPEVCNFILTLSTDQVAAFGCTAVANNYSPACIRISDIDDPEEWSLGPTTEAEQHYLKGNGRIVAAREVQGYVMVWTDAEMHLGSYSGSWRFDRMGSGGLAGLNAVAIVGNRAFWVGPDAQFYSAAPGEAPRPLVSPLRDEFEEGLSPGQMDKIVAASTNERGEVIWFYPHKAEGYENSRALRLSVIDGAWSKSIMARTAYVDANPAQSPVGVTYDGKVYWHERGRSADGSPLSWYIETGGQYLAPAEQMILLRGLMPDFRGVGAEKAVGAITLKMEGRMMPQDDWSVLGSYVFNAATQRVDFLHSTRIAKLRFEGSGSPVSVRFGKPTFDVTATGRE